MSAKSVHPQVGPGRRSGMVKNPANGNFPAGTTFGDIPNWSFTETLIAGEVLVVHLQMRIVANGLWTAGLKDLYTPPGGVQQTIFVDGVDAATDEGSMGGDNQTGSHTFHGIFHIADQPGEHIISVHGRGNNAITVTVTGDAAGTSRATSKMVWMVI